MSRLAENTTVEETARAAKPICDRCTPEGMCVDCRDEVRALRYAGAIRADRQLMGGLRELAGASWSDDYTLSIIAAEMFARAERTVGAVRGAA